MAEPITVTNKIEKAKDLFEIPEGVTYLNCVNMAPQIAVDNEDWNRRGSRKDDSMETVSARMVFWGGRVAKYCGEIAVERQ